MTPRGSLKALTVSRTKNSVTLAEQFVFVDQCRYRVDAVRSGGMGLVWLLTFADGSIPSSIYRPRLAVKTFDFSPDASVVERELNIWIGLSHPSIVPLLRIGTLEYNMCALMPRMANNLEMLAERHGPFRERDIANLLLPVVAALRYAWSERKILHLDLKPSNLLIDERKDSLAVTDWGISRLVTAQTIATTPGSDGRVPHSGDTCYGAGTPLYMAPERFSGKWTLTPSADIYSLGMIAIQLKAGLLPFRFGQVSPVQEIHSHRYFLNADRLLRDHGKAFRTLCLDCIQPDPTTRPASFSDLERRLRSLAGKRWWST